MLLSAVPPPSAFLLALYSKDLGSDATLNFPLFHTFQTLLTAADAVPFTGVWCAVRRQRKREMEGSWWWVWWRQKLQEKGDIRKESICACVTDKMSTPLQCHVSETLLSLWLLNERRSQTGRPSHSGKRAYLRAQTHTLVDRARKCRWTSAVMCLR